MKRWLSLFITAIILIGCKVGPDYRRPEVELPSDWRWKIAEPRDAVPRGAWWTAFGDPVLDELQAQAASANQDLKAALARVDQARASARMSEAELYPGLSAGGDFARYRTSGNSPSPVPFPVPSFRQSRWTTSLDLSYEVDLWGKVRRGLESSRLRATSVEAARVAIQLAVQADLASTYFTLKSTMAEIDFLERTIVIRDEAFAIFEQRLKAGMSSTFEVERARVEVASARANLAAARQRRAELHNALALLCGKAPRSFTVEPATGEIRIPDVAPDLPSHLLERRPDVAEAERQMASRNASIGVAKAAFFPVVRLTTSGGSLSGELQDLYEWESRVWSIGPSLSIPLFQGGRLRADLRRAQAAHEEAVALYRQKLLVAFREVEDALAALQFLRDQLKARREAATAAAAAARLAFERYRAGAVNFLEVVDAEQARLLNEVTSLRTANEQVQATVRLIKALGGGWEGEPARKP